MIKPDVCLYHANCLDGFGAAFAIWLRFGDSVKYLPVSYGEETPWTEITGRRVAIVDFSYKRDIMWRMHSLCPSVLVLDHHKTAEAELKGFWRNTAGGPPGAHIAEAYFNMKHSGAVMAWDYFHGPEPAPLFFQLIQDRDLWTKKLAGVDDFHMAMLSFERSFTTWDRLFRAWSVAGIIDQGVGIRRYFKTLVTYHMAQAHVVTIGSHVVPAVNAPGYVASEVAGELAEKASFAGTYTIDGEMAYWSLRSRGDYGVDVSEIAKWFGGGGHKNAAGFRIPLTRMVSEGKNFKLTI